jgi:hypothetical protein
MTLVTTWDILQLEHNTADGKVIVVHYTISATDGSKNTSAYGSVGVAGDVVVPYDEVTKELALKWVKSGLGDEGIGKLEEVLQGELDDMKTPKTAAGLPWT